MVRFLFVLLLIALVAGLAALPNQARMIISVAAAGIMLLFFLICLVLLIPYLFRKSHRD